MRRANEGVKRTRKEDHVKLKQPYEFEKYDNDRQRVDNKCILQQKLLTK